MQHTSSTILKICITFGPMWVLRCNYKLLVNWNIDEKEFDEANSKIAKLRMAYLNGTVSFDIGGETFTYFECILFL